WAKLDHSCSLADLAGLAAHARSGASWHCAAASGIGSAKVAKAAKAVCVGEVNACARLHARSSVGAKPAPPSASGDAGPVPAPSERKAYGSNKWNAPISASDDAVSVTTEHAVDLGA